MKKTLLPIFWLLASALMGLSTFRVLPAFDRWLPGLGMVTGVLYIILLIWHFASLKPSATELPDLPPLIFATWRFGRMFGMIILVLVLMFVIGVIAHPQLVIVGCLTLIAIGIGLRWRQRITTSIMGYGIAAGAFSLIGSLLIRESNLYTIALYGVCPVVLIVAGALLLESTQLTQIRTLKDGILPALRSFGWGCVLAIPPALLNIGGGAYKNDTNIDAWFKPLAALTPGIAEEVWARLFLTTLCYALLRPTTNSRPRRALTAAILIGALTHGLAHLPSLMILSPAGLGYIVAGLLFGVPMALLFIKRDLEQAIGYHFFIDFARFIAAFVLLSHP